MTDSNFFRLDLEGKKVWLSCFEVLSIRRDILLYFDDTVSDEAGDRLNVLLLTEIFNQEYWKFLSINFDISYAESTSYKLLIERGCLALINAITLEILYEPVHDIKKIWGKRAVSAETILSYLEAYRPSSEELEEGKKMLVSTLYFIKQLSWDDIDEHGDIKSFDTGLQANWFNLKIVKEYYKNVALEYCE